MFPLFVVAAVVADAISPRGGGFVARPLSSWCRCTGPDCARSAFSGLFNDPGYWLASPGVRQFLQMAAAQKAIPWRKVERATLTKDAERDVEYVVQGSTWPVYAPLASLPPLAGAMTEVMAALNEPVDARVLRSPSGTLALVKRVLPAFTPLKLHFVLNDKAEGFTGNVRLDRVTGEVYFTDPVEIPVLFEREDKGWTLWMSHTPNEVLSQLGHVKKAAAMAAAAKREKRPFHVVIGGLGIGWMLTQIANLPGVTQITLIDKNAELADFILPKLCGSVPKRVKVDVRIGDLFASTAGLEHADLAIIDIWPTYGDVTRDYDRLRGAWPSMPIEVWGELSDDVGGFGP